MNRFLCVFFPAIIAVAVLRALQGRRLDWQYAIMAYGTFVVVINLLIFLFQTFILGFTDDLLQEISFTNLYMVQYLVAAILFALVLPFVFEFLRKALKLRLDVTDREKDGPDKKDGSAMQPLVWKAEADKQTTESKDETRV